MRMRWPPTTESPSLRDRHRLSWRRTNSQRPGPMQHTSLRSVCVVLSVALSAGRAGCAVTAPGTTAANADQSIQLGPRPFYLVDGMDDGPLKSTLLQCANRSFHRTDFAIGHRGAALQFPEHTEE